MTHWKVYVYTNDFSTTQEATSNGVRVGHLTKRERVNSLGTDIRVLLNLVKGLREIFSY